MIELTVIDDGSIPKTLEIQDEKEAIKVQQALVEAGCIVRRVKVG